MKKPYIDEYYRWFLYQHRNKLISTYTGAKLDLHFAWKKLLRIITKTFKKLWKH